MKKIVVISLVLFNINMSATGTLDSSFSIAGLVTTSFGVGSSDLVRGVIFQPDGKIVAVGESNSAGTDDFALARYNSDGTLDSSFGTGGLVTTHFGSNSDLANAIILQSDGKIIAVGQSDEAGTNDFALARYNPDGTLDSSFGTGGLVTTHFGSNSDLANAVILQSDGKIIAVGRSDAAGTNDFALARYNPDGTLDSSFGTGGLVTTNFGGSTDRARGAVLQPDGKIVVVGESNAASPDNFALARYNPDGTLDSSFGTAGLVTTNFGGSLDFANAVILQSDGKITAVGRSNEAGTDDFALARYNSDGTLDSSFGTAGLVTTNLGGIDVARVAILQSDGKIMAVGISNASGNFSFALARYNADGSLDGSFGAGGLVTTNFGGTNDQAWGAILQADGKIVVAGQSNLSGTFDFALARYLIPSITISQLARDLRAKYLL